MNDKVIYLDSNNQVICWGDMYGCDNYIKQLYSYSIEDLHYEEYLFDSRYSYFYEDYEVVQVRGIGIFLTLGQVSLMKDAYSEELRGINLIKQELDKLSRMDHVFSDEILDNLIDIERYMDIVYKEYMNYNSRNLFEDLDFDALHQMQLTDRENKGLPIFYLK